MNFILLILITILLTILIKNKLKISKLKEEIKVHDRLDKKIKDMRDKEQLQVEVNKTINKTKGNGEIIMIIDDEYPVANLISLFLSNNNFEPKLFTNTEEAIDFFKDNNDIIDIIITDYTMPRQIDGIDFVKELKSINNEVPIIVISGHGYVKLKNPDDKLLISKYLTKPLSHKDLVDVVVKILKEKEEDKNE